MTNTRADTDIRGGKVHYRPFGVLTSTPPQARVRTVDVQPNAVRSTRAAFSVEPYMEGV